VYRLSPAEKGRLNLRPVTAADARILHAWRNDLDTRLASRKSEPVEWAEHENWLAAALKSSNRMLRIAEIEGHPVGVVRADRSGEFWELSWNVAPGIRGQGIGCSMLALFVAAIDGPLRAAIRRDNVASIKIATSIGMIRTGLVEGDFELWMRGANESQLSKPCPAPLE
jgi:RimJ/RimL family protein N-acetyltransferase